MKRPSSLKRANTRARQLTLGFIFLLLLVGVAVWSLSSRSQPRIGDINAADSANQQLVSLGQQLYATRCAGCHGGNLEGQPNWRQPQANGTLPAPPLDATGPARQRTDQQLFSIIANGGQSTAPSGTASGMPAFGSSLSDAEIWAIVSYIKSAWPPSTQP
jgi:mono/diheme cytochrome c family protein